MQSDKVARLHDRLSKVAAAAVAVTPSSAPSSAPSTPAHSAAAKPASPDDDAIVAALKATLDKEEKDAEQKVVYNAFCHQLALLFHAETPFFFSLRRRRDANKRAPKYSRNFTIPITLPPPQTLSQPPRRPARLPRRAKRTQKLPFASELACVFAPYLKPPSRVTYFRELDLKFEADKQKALSGILAEVIRTRNPYLLRIIVF